MILQSLINVFSPMTFLLLILGTAWGLVAGALPGLSASMAVILMLPFTYGMTAIQSVVVLVAVYVGSMCGGSFSAILLKTPGTPSAVATVFDGYPMALKGEAAKAIGLSITASAFGGIFSGVIMVTSASLLAVWALRFQSAEFFALSVLGLSCIASIGSKNPLKAMISALAGLMVSTVGLDAIAGAERFTLGKYYLMNGIDYIPVMIGAYALAEVYRSILEGLQGQKFKAATVKAEMIGISHIIRNWKVYLKSSIIGTAIGIMPAAGGSIAALISYGEAVRSSKTPELFGHGAEEGVVASEAANNAAVGGTLVPTLVLGIPGGNVAAILLAAFTMHGLIPGPMLLKNQPDLLYTIFMGVIVSSLLLFVVGKFVSVQFSKITKLPKSYLLTIIVVLGFVGAFSLKNNIYDMYIMFFFSFFGYFLEKFNYSTSSFILGIVLGPICENGLRKHLILSGGSWLSILSRPISLIVLMLSIVSFATPFLRGYLKRRKVGSIVEQK